MRNKDPQVGLTVAWTLAFLINCLNMCMGQKANWFLVLVPSGVLALNYWLDLFD